MRRVSLMMRRRLMTASTVVRMTSRALPTILRSWTQWKMIQEKMLEVLGFTPERAAEQFGFLLTAFKYGVPPHAGLAYGLDRRALVILDASCHKLDHIGHISVKV
jgi:hypothetical protein